MKDRVFVGADVEAALAEAASLLGLPPAEIRYVVLEAGTPAARGLQPTPARIAVLIQTPGDPPPAGRAVASGEAGGPLDPTGALSAVVRAVADAGGLEVDTAFSETDDALVLEVRGRDAGFFHGPDGWGEPLLALEHLLQRTYGPARQDRPLHVRCEGYRDRRDSALAEEARRLAASVRADGQARTMEPSNAYDRRIVHVALQGEAGVRTFSVGEGRDRRVTVAPLADVAESKAGTGDGHGA